MSPQKEHREKAVNSIVESFCSTRGIDISSIPPNLKKSIFSICAPFYLYIECFDIVPIHKELNAIDEMLIMLIHRSFNSVSGCLALIATGHLQEAEVLVRTVVESSMTISYILDGDSHEKAILFFQSFIREERKQNRNWRKSLDRVSYEIREDHLKRISDKDEVLSYQSKFIEILAKQLGYKIPIDNKWPHGIFQLFQALDKELDYRTVYAALCSQAHQDAEDVLNQFISDRVESNENSNGYVRNNKHIFSIFMVLIGTRYFVNCIELMSDRFGFISARTESTTAMVSIDEELETISSSLGCGIFPEEWSGRLIDGI